MTAAAPRARRARPTLFIIGGAEDRLGKATVLRRFVRLAGGRQSRIVLIPTASSFQDEVTESYRDVFTRLGAPDPAVVNPEDRAASHDPALVAALDGATGIFMSGGSQLRLSQRLPGTPLGEALHRAHERGAVVGGTSAGASIMSQFMISMGDEGITPRQRHSQLSAGLGLLEGVIIDQHFAQRSRYGRLMSVVAASPHLLGVGIDEDTAIEVRDRSTFTVHGSGAVFVLDCREATSDAPDARRGAPLLVSGAVVHSLPAGATFDLSEVRLVDFVEKHPDVAVALASAKA
jgi:cyanophycinase